MSHSMADAMAVQEKPLGKVAELVLEHLRTQGKCCMYELMRDLGLSRWTLDRALEALRNADLVVKLAEELGPGARGRPRVPYQARLEAVGYAVRPGQPAGAADAADAADVAELDEALTDEQRVHDYLAEHGVMSLSDLALELGLGKETVKRLLRLMQERGEVRAVEPPVSGKAGRPGLHYRVVRTHELRAGEVAR